MIRIALALGLAALLLPAAAGAQPVSTASEWRDTLVFAPVEDADSTLAEPTGGEPAWQERAPEERTEWLGTPFEEELLAGPDHWERAGHAGPHTDFVFAYNRVDPVRMGLRAEARHEGTLYPRLVGRLEYAFGRDRTLYGGLIEQPLAPGAWLAVGGALYRRTAHNELQQVGALENSVDLFVARADFHDYYEREGQDGYLALRLRPLTELSLHARAEDHRSLPSVRDLTSLAHSGSDLRPNPAIQDGRLRSWVLRAERRARRGGRARPGLYHWGEVERAGGRMGGDFTYTRALADLRSYLRLSPGQLLGLRLVAGTASEGALPYQKEFTVGGVDGLRAHAFGEFRGDQMFLGMTEYSVSLWGERSRLPGSAQLITFVDCGKAWDAAGNRYQLERQRLPVDGGFGFATSEDEMRVYLAKNLQEPGSNFLVSVRLQRAF